MNSVAQQPISEVSKVPRRLFNAYPDRSIAVCETESLSSTNPIEAERNDGERSRLRSDGDQSISWNSDSNITITDTARSRKYDLHQSQREDRIQKSKTSLSSLFASVTSAIFGDRIGSSSSQLLNTPSNTNSTTTFPHREDTKISSSNPNCVTQPLPLSIGESIPLGDTVTNGSNSGYGRNETSGVSGIESSSTFFSMPSILRTEKSKVSRVSPFCPCFSPTVSEDSESEDERPPSMGLSVSRDLRERLVTMAEVSNQPTLTQGYQPGFPSSDLSIHRTVEYANYLVKDMYKILAATYYWGVMDRFKAEELLEGKPEGTFLLRDSAQKAYLFSVSFRRYQRTLHARIEQENHRFGFDIQDSSVFSASTVTELIENYKDPSRCLFFEPQLTHPLPRDFVFSLQELCRGVIAANTTYTKVSQLCLPQQLKQFIRDFHYEHPVRTTVHE